MNITTCTLVLAIALSGSAIADPPSAPVAAASPVADAQKGSASTTASTQASEGPISAKDYAKIASFYPAPTYPRTELTNGITGTVMLVVRIDETGAPINIVVETSSGHRELDRAAIDAVKKWKFHPHRQDAVPVKGVVRVPVVFSI